MMQNSTFLNPVRYRFIFGDFVCPNMNKDTYLILTEMKWVFLGCTNSLETQQEGQTRKQNSVEEKGSRLLPQNVLSGEKEKSAKFTPLWFQTLIERKTNKHWNEKRGESTYFMWEKRLNILYKTKMLIFSVSHTAPRSSRPCSQRVSELTENTQIISKGPFLAWW